MTIATLDDLTTLRDGAPALPLQLDDAAADLLFHEAHTTSRFDDTPVPDGAIRAAYNLLRWAPTAFNCSPLRLLLVRTPEARERLVAHMSDGNKAKTLAAPLSLVAASDTRFHEHLDTLAPQLSGERDRWEAMPEERRSTARMSALIQVGYLVVALRATGLDVGPMSGFDPDGIDGEFFSTNEWQSLLVLNVGHAAATADAIRPRAERLRFHQASAAV